MSLNVVAIIKELLNAAGIEYSDVTESQLAGQTIYSIVTKESAYGLIGHNSDTIHAIDSLVKKIAEKRTPNTGDDRARPEDGLFLVDINDHRVKQIKDLQTKALIMADRARSFQYDVELSPMSAYERLIVHTTLADTSNIKTESQGEGRNRRVVIKYTT